MWRTKMFLIPDTETTADVEATPAENLNTAVEEGFQSRRAELFPSFGKVEETAAEEEPAETPEVQEETEEESLEEEISAREETSGREEETSQELEDLRAQVKNLEDKLAEQLKEKEEPAAKEDKEEKPAIVNWLSEEDYDNAMSSVEGFNEVISKVAKTVREQVLEEAYRKVPEVVTSQVSQQQAQIKEAEKFLAENPDIFQYGIETKQDLVYRQEDMIRTVNALSAKNPDWPTRKLYNEAAKEVRERYKIPKNWKQDKKEEGKNAETKKREKRAPANPASKPGNRVPPQKPDVNSFEAKKAKVFPSEAKE